MNVETTNFLWRCIRLVLPILGSAAAGAALLASASWIFHEDSASESIVGFLLMLPFAIAAVVVIGLPLFAVASWIDRSSWLSAGVCGVVGGVIASAIIRGGHVAMADLDLFALAGLTASLTFLILWRRLNNADVGPKKIDTL